MGLGRLERRSLVFLLAWVLFSSCTEAEPEKLTRINLVVTSDVAMDQVVIYGRDLDYNDDEIEIEVGGRDLGAQSLKIIVQPGTDGFATDEEGETDGVWSIDFPLPGEQLLLNARGEDSSGTVLASGAMLTAFVTDQSVAVTLELTAEQADCDGDGDGFFSCTCEFAGGDDPPCDCVDTDAAINPLQREECGDGIDNNCTGWPPDEECWPCEPGVCTVLSEDRLYLAGIGQCTFGFDDCDGDGCQGAGSPDDSETDGDQIDNDCNGDVDEGGVCAPGDERYCLLGQIDARGMDCARGEVAADCAASELARGTCVRGVQTCTGGTWGGCEGEVKPNRPAGSLDWGEGVDGSDLQCDGLDNDCDGLYDERPENDADADGYTSCGNCRAEFCDEIPFCCAPPADGTVAWWADGAIDCDDSRAWINPGMDEDCRLRDSQGGYPAPTAIDAAYYDEDCRCDHNDTDLGDGDEIGLPTRILGGGSNCALMEANLDCSVVMRSDPTPIGNCDDTQLGTPQYYAGYSPDDISGDCRYCVKPYGDDCERQTGACETKAEACGTNCDGWFGSVVEYRPLCSIGDSATDATPETATCIEDASGNPVPPVWVFIPDGEDPNGDCPSSTCNGAGACNP